jgi:hypothetical protein
VWSLDGGNTPLFVLGPSSGLFDQMFFADAGSYGLEIFDLDGVDLMAGPVRV